MIKRVLLGMSGGVDSSVAAHLLKKDGYEVVGVTLLLWCNEAVEDAKSVCAKLQIEHHIVDLSDTFREKIVENFIDEYHSGHTPNPCINCNRHIKFGEMFDIADRLGCEYIATGHYAEKSFDKSTGLYKLNVSANQVKDQSYFLYCLDQQKLSRVLFPIAGYDKEYIRSVAEDLGLDVSHKKDSQDICFVPDGDYASFVEKHSHSSLPGDFVSMTGEKMGRHKGIIHYTIGQRKGLGLALPEPAFVIGIDAENNRVILGNHGAQYAESLDAHDANFVMPDFLEAGCRKGKPLECLVKIRYSAKPVKAVCTIADHSHFHLEFEEPQRAVTPGQSVVLYDLNFSYVLAGGIIASSASSKGF